MSGVVVPSASEGLVTALHVDGPVPERADELMLFGRFVGSWTLERHGITADGSTIVRSGELHFGWVLGGRAVQDIWIVPGRGLPGEGVPPDAFHGSTIRFYDPTIDRWRSTWIEPVNGRVRRFIGQPVGDDIVLISDEDEPRLRWSFTAIAPDSFTWVGETSHDGGLTWDVEERMYAVRDGATR
ncbi:hypothetical protein WEH80_21480 [Actinomycetes bacterium KLBMP 9759]